jgi:nickel-dependent lactate racemase
MRVRLAYGQGHLPVEFPDDRTTVIAPSRNPGLPNERAAVLAALQQPLGAPPLKERVKPADRVCIAFTDITRATPNDRIIPWLLEHLSHLPRENVTLLNQLGTHRPNTPAELDTMLTPAVARQYRVVNHEPENPGALVQLGTTGDGTPALINRHLVEADVRIITGFIEPHFFAGFSGGPKGIIPGCAGLRTVMSNHRSENIRHPNATFGFTAGNPLWEEIRDVAQRVGPSFLLNVTLNEERHLTGVFAGDLIEAHSTGCEFVRHSAMQPVGAAFDIVVTTNSGYPLDLNLYQGVKGMSAAARIAKPGGLIILASECREGVPVGSSFARLLQSVVGPDELLKKFDESGPPLPEQWQVQILAQIQRQAEVRVFSSLSDEILRACHLEPCHDIGADVRDRLDRLDGQAQVAVLPQGPLTIPYLA